MNDLLTLSSYPKVDFVSVIMPVFNQASFIARAIFSLQNQSISNWELLIINDGSTDDLEEAIKPFLENSRIRYFINDKNKGLGYSLNRGIEEATYNYIAYLPADDIYYKDHLKLLLEELISTSVDLVYSGIMYKFNDISETDHGIQCFDKISNHTLQLVQVMHLKNKERWIEREELVTDNLGIMFWNKYITNYSVSSIRKITCEWVDHPEQRTKIINDRIGGGIFKYKKYYSVKEPIRFKSTEGNFIDEIENFSCIKKVKQNNNDGLKILIVGELSYNPERICAFEEKGHKLYGLWTDSPANFNTIGPLPFGNVEDIPIEDWKERVKEVQPDIIYALLNYQTIEFAHKILIENPGIPYIWHFKEGPFYARKYGLWSKLIDLYTKSDGQIYNNNLVYDWFKQFIPEQPFTFILDGDLAKIDWFTNDQSPLLSDEDGSVHILVAGRPYGVNSGNILEMAEQNIHLHVYGDIFHSQAKAMLEQAKKLAPDHLHLHPNCHQKDWVKEFSKYDAGLLHHYQSNNNGEILQASWNDLNLPARISTYAIAGLPMLMYNNIGHRVISQELLEKENMLLTFKSFSDLGPIFQDKKKVSFTREQVWKNRNIFSFDYYVDDLIAFFRKVIRAKNSQK